MITACMENIVVPDLPPDAAYAKYWCEENVYHLASRFLLLPEIVNHWEVYVAFISNSAKTVCPT